MMHNHIKTCKNPTCLCYMAQFFHSQSLNGRTIEQDIARKSTHEDELSVSLFDISNGLEDIKKNYMSSFSK